MKLHELSPPKGSVKNKKRLGRGVGSGNGKTSGKGSKGQKCRSGGKVRLGFEGGQMPLQRRLPKRGFTNIFQKKYSIININDLKKFQSNENQIDAKFLQDKKIIKGKNIKIKLLGNGNIDFPINIKVNKVSQSAKAKIEAAGGKVEVI